MHTKREGVCAVYGLCRSVLSELKYFEVTSGSLIPDVMHDVLEGVLQYEAKLMLLHFVNQDHYFTLAQLNQQMELGFSESKNRPSTISHSTFHEGDNSLKQSGKCSFHSFSSFLNFIVASQMWLLGRLLPHMIGHWIPRDNEHWLLYLLLLEIVDILLAPEVQIEDIAVLSTYPCTGSSH